jgi:hypothetical protein
MKRIKPEASLAGQTWWRTGEPDLVPYLTAIMNAKLTHETVHDGHSESGLADTGRTDQGDQACGVEQELAGGRDFLPAPSGGAWRRG